MFEEYYELLPDVDAYLDRIGYEGPRECTVEVLDKLLECQQLSVPYENMEVFAEGKVPSLAVCDIFDKIVTRHRGGYCFEVNGAFYALLKTLGFKCWNVMGCMLEGDPYPQLPLHRGTIVAFGDDRRWVDCGAGGLQPGCSISIYDEGIQHTPTGDFRLEHVDFHYDLYAYDRHAGEWVAKLSFREEPVEDVDFIVANYYCAAEPESIFRTMRFANLRTPDGSLALENNTLREHIGGELIVTELAEEDIEGVLRERFGVYL